MRRVADMRIRKEKRSVERGRKVGWVGDVGDVGVVGLVGYCLLFIVYC